MIEAVRQAYRERTPIYPLGGETSLEYGLPAKRQGLGLSLADMSGVVDYPARDMTITVQAGITMQQLAETLATERQQLPVDVPQAARATVGGVIATNFNGPRCYGYGTLRDYVIGIQAVDGHGMPFKGGGRVVKNVAGYDFCKLLTGSLGTLGLISQVTLKLKPLTEQSLLLATAINDWDRAEAHLAALADSQTMPAVVELLCGPAWEKVPALQDLGGGEIRLVVGFEGTGPDVAWMQQQLLSEWKAQGLDSHRVIEEQDARDLWSRLAEFPAEPSPLVLKASVVPSGLTRLMKAARELDAACSLQAHAGNGILLARFADFPVEGLARTVVGRLQALASQAHGHLQVLANPSGAEMTHQCAWGGINAPFGLMTDIKRQFDPRNILNPGRFVYL